MKLELTKKEHWMLTRMVKKAIRVECQKPGVGIKTLTKLYDVQTKLRTIKLEAEGA